MEGSSIPGLYPLQRCKTLHLVRHAEGIHNMAGEKDYAAYSSEQNFDSHLTTLGWLQVDNLRKRVQETGLSKKIELVVVSPLLRAMQTAVGVFGGEGQKQGSDDGHGLPLMVADAAESHRPEISSQNCAPFLAVELCRERFGAHPCDRRRSISYYRSIFPAIDFSLIESDDDVLWKPEAREPIEEVAVRGMKFFTWLFSRKEKEIAIVTHRGFLYNSLAAFGGDCHPSLKTELCKQFLNCELRSVVIVDKSMMGSDPATK
ncbi:hypothetical protein like AT1G58280 [Hibiscus trionum]|uniref:Phosphoglycerate mutase-like protein 1 n=1 Tax=Hibiscus trionum TaxID=183268 RepID=A0A9W7IAF4_HIBTR|nr:hypothetical protein like AT1G58280 [Hibiscus trionum]